jgi:uncharacterized repeat protein (TIGR03803 family)
MQSKRFSFAWSVTLVMAFALILCAAISGGAQTLNVLHNFTGGSDGLEPYANLAADKAGNLYSTTIAGGNGSGGTVFRLKHQGSGWTFATLYSFPQYQGDGANPYAPVIVGPNGTLYGTSTFGGSGGPCSGSGCGTVFNLRPPATFCRSVSCPWTETILYQFQANNHDGGNPLGSLVFDASGNLYGTTTKGGAYQSGTVYELAPSNGGWTETILYNFTGGTDGANPASSLIFDQAGNLYGTTYAGGNFGVGTVFQLTLSGSGWSENVIHHFQGGSEGASPYGGVTFDSSGNLYGTTTGASTGVVFELTPSSGSWTYSVLHNLSGDGSFGNLIIDNSGNIYGTAVEGGTGYGSIFELTPSNGSWTYTELYDFTGGADGWGPFGGVIRDQAGNLYGATYIGGANGDGVVFEFTP